MKYLFYVVLLGLAFTACQNRVKETVKEEPGIFGTWRYELATRVMQTGAEADTAFENMAAGTIQFYDVFNADSTLVAYGIQGDSVISKRVYKYEVRGDSLYARSDSFNTVIRILELADSTLTIGTTKMHKDTIYRIQSVSRKCQLPQVRN